MWGCWLRFAGKMYPLRLCFLLCTDQNYQSSSYFKDWIFTFQPNIQTDMHTVATGIRYNGVFNIMQTEDTVSKSSQTICFTHL